MNVERRGIRARLAAASVLLVALWSVGGCGGSGSSGFDVSPLSESQSIAHAIDDQQCVAHEQQTFCASGVKAESGQFEGAAVTIDVPDKTVVCHDGTTTQECTASLEFTKEGFLTPNTLLAAVSESERGPWTQAPLSVSEDVSGPRIVTITVPATFARTNRKPLIAAVLVYVGVAPETVPQSAAHLADFGVDLVYVSPRLELVIPD